jgi:SAM-dependent MidA family methyltransferase
LSEIRNISLADHLRALIKRDGPINFHDWMSVALYDEREGYYCRPDRIRQGRAGDYRTAPETSSLFAATFARYFAELFVELGSPSHFTIVEAGAGSGQFAQGVLTNLKSKHPEVFAATNYVIEEVGAGSRSECAARLAEFSDCVSIRSPTVREGNSRNEAISDGQASDKIAGIVFSNELIDAFPVHRVIQRNGELRELCVDMDGNDFVWTECDLADRVADYCQRAKLQLTEGQIAEINLDAETFVARASSIIEDGFLITVDYGAERDELLNDPARRQGTLRAFRRHQIIDQVLSHPGEVDLTTTIDWTQIKEAGKRMELKTVGFERLDQFLLNEGLLDELEVAASQLGDADALRLRTSAREMIMPNGMAALFQILVQRKKS